MKQKKPQSISMEKLQQNLCKFNKLSMLLLWWYGYIKQTLDCYTEDSVTNIGLAT